MISLLIILLLIASISTESNLNNEASDLYLYTEVYLKSDNVDLWKENMMQVVEEINQQNSNTNLITFQINDTLYAIFEKVNDLSNLKEIPRNGIQNYFDTDYLNSIHFVKNGLLSNDDKFTSLTFENVLDSGQYAIFEKCHIKPDNINQLEDNWHKWFELHDSIHTGLHFIILNGLIGFDNPYYLAITFAPDSISMDNSFNKLWSEGKEKATELSNKEGSYYRKYERYLGSMITELSYWHE